MAKKRVFSGIQPSGDLHIGNYFGAILTWVKEQDDKENIFCIVDEHAITVPQDPKELKRRILDLAKVYLAAGIEPKKSNIFVQSSRPEHTELAWILNCSTNVGELIRMTQFKSKAKFDLDAMIAHLRDSVKNIKITPEIHDALKKTMSTTKDQDKEIEHWVEVSGSSAVNASRMFVEQEFNKFTSSKLGLFDYPVLMAADILLYDSDEVPVGSDQKQHVELTRDIAERMNKRYGDIFRIPEFTTNKETTRIMSLTDPTTKMSKSDDSDNSRINILDTPEQIRGKFAKATTDSGNEIRYDKDKKPGISNLLNIMAACTSTEVPELEKKYIGVTYGEFKKDVAEAVVALLEPFQAKYNELTDEYVLQVLRAGADKVAPKAQETLKRVKDAIGLGI